MRRTHASSKLGWVRALVLVCSGLTLRAAPARADATAPPAERDPTALPLPPPGTVRLIRIGPQMVLEQDSQGRIRMADEPPPKPERPIKAAVIMLGLVTAGATLLIGRNDLPGTTGGRAGER